MNERVKEIQILANKLDALKDFKEDLYKEDVYMSIFTDVYTSKVVMYPTDIKSKEFVKSILNKHFEEIKKEISEEINRIDNYLNNNFRY